VAGVDNVLGETPVVFATVGELLSKAIAAHRAGIAGDASLPTAIGDIELENAYKPLYPTPQLSPPLRVIRVHSHPFDLSANVTDVWIFGGELDPKLVSAPPFVIRRTLQFDGGGLIKQLAELLGPLEILNGLVSDAVNIGNGSVPAQLEEFALSREMFAPNISAFLAAEGAR
jgi:hypothetical protein